MATGSEAFRLPQLPLSLQGDGLKCVVAPRWRAVRRPEAGVAGASRGFPQKLGAAGLRTVTTSLASVAPQTPGASTTVIGRIPVVRPITDIDPLEAIPVKAERLAGPRGDRRSSPGRPC
jgi:hypothetical protein